jgi:predicted Zn-dependent peptidase
VIRSSSLLPALLAAALLFGAAVTPLAGQAEPLPPNPFGIFETVVLPNGLRVWYGHMPGATLTAMAVVVPYGRDQDPPGREQAAHFLEHVLLSDRGGATEAELVRELTARGGTFSGITGPHSTVYPLSIGNDQAAYGVEWLYGVVAPRAFAPEVVERNRAPVEVELGLRAAPGGALAAWLNHRALHPPGFWEREFGYAAAEERRADQRRGLAAVTAADLRRYYETYYGPATMTLVVVTGRPRVELQHVVEGTFGMLPWRPPPPPVHASPRQQESRRVHWRAAGTTRLALRYRIETLDARDHLRLMLVEDLLRERLMRRLRTGSVKAVYSVGTMTEIRGPAAFFGVVADMDPAREALVRQVVEEELERLRAAGTDSAFYADRDALARALRVEYASPGALRNWAAARLQRPGLHTAFPDIGEYYATVGPDSIGALAARLFVPANLVASTARPLPVHPLALALLAWLTIAAAVRLYRRLAFRPADMSGVRYVARLRAHPAVEAGVALVGAVTLLVLLRLAGAALHHAAEAWLLPAGSFTLLAGAAGTLLFGSAFGAIAVVGRRPRKVLVFEDEVRLKSATYRSLLIPARRVTGARIVEDRYGLRLRGAAPAAARSGVLLELADGTGWLLGVRDCPALQRAISDMVRRNGAGAEPPPPSTGLALVAAGGDECVADG